MWLRQDLRSWHSLVYSTALCAAGCMSCALQARRRRLLLMINLQQRQLHKQGGLKHHVAAARPAQLAQLRMSCLCVLCAVRCASHVLQGRWHRLLLLVKLQQQTRKPVIPTS
jgi:hypothetical protein